MKKILLPILILLLGVLGYKYILIELLNIAPPGIRPASTFLNLKPEPSPEERNLAFLQPSGSNPVAIVHEWVPYYYRHPDPTNITAIFTAMAAKGRIEAPHPEGNRGGTLLPTIKRLAEHGARTLQHLLPDSLRSLLPSHQQIVLDAGQQDAFVHFFATALQGQTDELNKFKAAATTQPEPWKSLAGRVVAQTESYQPAEETSVADINLLWAEFMATGDTSIVNRLTDANTFSESRANNPELVRAIETSLFNYSRLYEDVLEFVLEGARDGENFRSKRLKELKKALNSYVIRPGQAHLQRGINHTNMQEYSKALSEYHKALTYCPDYDNVFVNMATAYEYMGKMDKAFAASQKAYQVDPSNPEVCYGLARHYYMQRKYDQSLKMNLKAAEIDPSNANYIYAIADDYKCMGDKVKAITYFHQYLKKSPHGLYPDRIRAYLVSVNAPFVDDPNDLISLLKQREYGKLETEFSRLLREKKKNKDGGSLLADAYDYVSGYEDAKYAYDQWQKYFEDWVNSSPSSHFANGATGMFFINFAWHARGTGYAHTITKEGQEAYRQRMQEAVRYLEKAYELDPSDPIVPARLIKVGMALGKDEAQIETQFRRALQADPNCYEAFSAKFMYLTPKWHGSREAMFEFARDCVRTAPENSMIPRLLSKAHWEMYFFAEDRSVYFKRSGVWDELKPVYTRLCNQFPQSMVLQNWFARTAYLAGDFATARIRFALIQEKWDESVWGNYKYFARIRNEVLGKNTKDV